MTNGDVYSSIKREGKRDRSALLMDRNPQKKMTLIGPIFLSKSARGGTFDECCLY